MKSTVNIFLTGAVQFKGKSYKKGDTLTTNMEPFQSLQIQSEDDLSGTKVNSQHPVAVLSGHSCAPSNEGCSHVFEQLQPVTSWGTSYLVPGMSFQSKSDQVFALASKAATFEYQSGGKKMKTNVEAGQLMKFNVSVSSPLSIHSTERIQVLLFGTGGKYKGKPFGSFFTKIPDVNSFNLRYNLIGQDNFDNNLGIIIAKSSIAPEIQYNGKVLDITNWNMFPESDYSWAEYSYGAGSSSNKMKHPTSPFGLLSIGYSKDMAYGTVAPSIQGQGVPITPVPEIKGPNVQIAPVPETKGSGFGIEGQQEGKPGHFEFKFGVSKGNEGKAVQQQMGAGSGSGTEGQQIGKPGQFEFSWKPATFQYKFDVSKGNEGTAGQPQTGAGSQPGSSSWQSGGFNFQFGGNGQQDMTGGRKVTTQGKYFIVGFLENTFSDDSPRREILVTGITPSTTVTVTMNKSTFNKTIKVGKGETVTFDLPKPSEVKGSGVCPCTTIIKSDADITVMARNFKKTSGDVSLIYPVDQWGTEYYIITPSKGPSAAIAEGPSNHYPEFAVVTYEFETTVNISLTGSVQFKGKNYKKGDTLTTNMEPFQSLQIQSIEDLSETRVNSQHPVAVLSGHSCAPSNEGCSHVFEQLQPVTSWGTSYFVPGMSFQSKSDQVFALASKSACFEYQSGGNKMKTKVGAGQLMKFNVSVSSPLSIHSTERIQVLLFGTGGKYKNKPFGPFMTKVPDVNSFNLQYNLIGQDNVDNNLGIIIAKSSIAPEIQYNGKVLNNTHWNVFPQSEYSWAEYNCGGGSSSNKMKHPTTPFGVLSIGYSKDMAYGTLAPDIQGPKVQISPVPETKGSQSGSSSWQTGGFKFQFGGNGLHHMTGPNVQISPVPETKDKE
ncbi:hypothetical protein GDO81_014640 [Engystomops pustulosus]|uniref:IgGFc-binding protein N-terminal domain-containing protein n=1 Tax=Engystomops pustulosus TaxID=76066 RepID=A0AAV7BC32_ENGPU|nr:hypothetical protein GDO81_014640 [Engystomops pustulosus]